MPRPVDIGSAIINTRHLRLRFDGSIAREQVSMTHVGSVDTMKSVPNAGFVQKLLLMYIKPFIGAYIPGSPLNVINSSITIWVAAVYREIRCIMLNTSSRQNGVSVWVCVSAGFISELVTRYK